MDRLYWFAPDPRSAWLYVKIGRRQYVRPSLRYDLARLHEYASWTRKIPRQTVALSSEANLMARARAAYKALKTSDIRHPLVGPLTISRMAWRHVTRRSKATSQRRLNLDALRYLKTFLDKTPDRFVIEQGPIEQSGRLLVEKRYILCWYRRCLFVGGKSHSLAVRILEEISYPRDWTARPVGVGDIDQTATLASWWCKVDRE
jgi:hypothetical protein